MTAVARRIEELLEAPARASCSEGAVARAGQVQVIRAGEHVFHVEWRATGDVSGVTAGVRALTSALIHRRKNMVSLLAVPFMGEAGRRICHEGQISWLDLSGNAHIEAPGIRIHVEGKENRFKRRGRASNPFAPKSARVARWLLMHPGQFHVQQGIASAIDVGAGYVSRVVRRLEELGLIERNAQGAVRARDPKVLLEAWAERYEFGQHQLLRGHVAAHSSEELTARLASALTEEGIQHAATGLAGAWLLTHYAAFRTVTFYLNQLPSESMLDQLGFHRDERGANVWLALPRDEGVFLGTKNQDGIPCVHPVQAWLDLKGHPERAAEAARQIEETLFTWRSHA